MPRTVLFPPEVAGDLPRITLIGSQEVRIEQHQGVTACQTGEIAFRVAAGEVVFAGAGLRFLHYTAQEAVLAGEISTVTFRRKGGRP